MANDWVDWVPIRFYGGQEPVLDWCNVGDTEFHEPFFDLDIEALLRDPFTNLFRRQELISDTIARRPNPETPAGFIFHMSRCGSTLATQMLACSPEHTVLSEPSMLGRLLARAPGQTHDIDNRGPWLRAVFDAFATRSKSPQRVFVKFDAGHTSELAFFKETFPEVPWIFLVRNPVEVMQSHVDQPHWHVDPSSPEVETARILRRICTEAADAHDASRSRIVDYRRVTDFVVDELPALFGFECDADLRAKMLDRTLTNSKHTGQPWTSDSDAKRRTATEALHRAADEEVGEIYEILCAMQSGDS